MQIWIYIYFCLAFFPNDQSEVLDYYLIDPSLFSGFYRPKCDRHKHSHASWGICLLIDSAPGNYCSYVTGCMAGFHCLYSCDCNLHLVSGNHCELVRTSSCYLMPANTWLCHMTSHALLLRSPYVSHITLIFFAYWCHVLLQIRLSIISVPENASRFKTIFGINRTLLQNVA